MNEVTELHYGRYTAQELDPEGLKVRISHPLLLRFGFFLTVLLWAFQYMLTWCSVLRWGEAVSL